MIRVLGKLPLNPIVACSGGPDSMAVVSFMQRARREFSILHFDHGTDHATEARQLVESFCHEMNIPLEVVKIHAKAPKGESLEKWWRDQRYNVFHSKSKPIITAHNLNDVAEWWIFTSLRGNPRVMPYRNKNVLKPFLPTKKSEFEAWCTRHSVPHVIDPSNSGDRFSRSLIRKNILPEALNVCPGFLTTMSKKIKTKYEETNK